MKVQVCTGKSCSDRFSPYILKRIEWDKAMYNLENLIVEACPCQWRCKEGPVVVMDGTIEVRMNGIKASKMIVDKMRKKLVPSKERKAKHEHEDEIGYVESMYKWK